MNNNYSNSEIGVTAGAQTSEESVKNILRIKEFDGHNLAISHSSLKRYDSICRYFKNGGYYMTIDDAMAEAEWAEAGEGQYEDAQDAYDSYRGYMMDNLIDLARVIKVAILKKDEDNYYELKNTFRMIEEDWEFAEYEILGDYEPCDPDTPITIYKFIDLINEFIKVNEWDTEED